MPLGALDVAPHAGHFAIYMSCAQSHGYRENLRIVCGYNGAVIKTRLRHMAVGAFDSG